MISLPHAAQLYTFFSPACSHPSASVLKPDGGFVGDDAQPLVDVEGFANSQPNSFNFEIFVVKLI